MFGELSFVPKILLCGDEAEFFSRVNERPFKIVGHVKFFGEVDGKPLNVFRDSKVYLNGTLQHVNELLKSIVRGDVDYLVFNALREFHTVFNALKSAGFQSPKIITLEQFNTLPKEFFCDTDAEKKLMAQFKNLNIRTLLDVDGYFAKGRLFTKGDNDLTAIDCITDKPLLPIKENLYAHAYKNFSKVGFKRYDAALIVERPPMDFLAAFTFLKNFSDRLITFARNGSKLQRYIAGSKKSFSEIKSLRTAGGKWFFLTRHKPPENFCMYVITHKPVFYEDKLPEGYKLIHAGRALNADLGYLGDDTSDNISALNPYLNEITALYWMWKNTSNEIIGLSHYRRFFTTADDDAFAYEKILTRDAALKILRDYDIITTFYSGEKNQREYIELDCGSKLAKLGESIIKKYLLQAQPDYLGAFDYVLSAMTFYMCNMFVTRRNIFDAYCKWLFSFLLDATEEILRTMNFETLQSKQRRVMGFFSERMMTTWLIKNRLRIKELDIMFIKDL